MSGALEIQALVSREWAEAERVAPIVAPYLQGFADARGYGVRHGPAHLFRTDAALKEWSAVALCGRRVKMWNFEGETTSDFCPRCIKAAELAAEK